MQPPFAYYRGVSLLGARSYVLDDAGGEYATILGFQLLDVVWCLLLVAYLDEVLPKQVGIRRHPLFCIICCKVGAVIAPPKRCPVFYVWCTISVFA